MIAIRGFRLHDAVAASVTIASANRVIRAIDPSLAHWTFPYQGIQRPVTCNYLMPRQAAQAGGVQREGLVGDHRSYLSS